ncbi:G-protein coupled receptor Mth2 isoform X1 [Bombus fervidus]|uniref:G-protein coupled receptor Mth2 isoform X1 n=1 Tax=Bombus fervidus TaxID=203811 RepID=UPI003AB4C1CD
MFRVVIIGLLSTILVIHTMGQRSTRLHDTTMFPRGDLVEDIAYGSTMKVESSEQPELFRSNKKYVKEERNVSTIPSTESVDYWTESASHEVSLFICCSYGQRLSKDRCIETASNDTFRFPALYDSNTLSLIDEAPNYQRYFNLLIKDPCIGRQRYKLNPNKNPMDAFMFLDNGSIYMKHEGNILRDADYCFGILDTELFDLILCFNLDENEDTQGPTKVMVLFPVGLIISVPFLFATFVAYLLIPEWKNIHGRTLRNYVGTLLVAYVILAVVQMTPQQQISDSLCIAFAFIIHFSFLASFFWLNVMCFDIWWTFGGFRSLQGSVKQRERKKFLIYSVYAWGCASLLTGVCAIMDFLPDIPEHFIKPQLGRFNCWFTTNKARAIYFYAPMGVTVFCNICLFISTALKIVQHKKDTAQHLKSIDSRRHDDNKQWFNLYLKLFIVMGINWSMEIISWLCNNSPAYIWYLTDLTNTLQGVLIFLIFVWKDKVKRLLLKRFSCHRSNILSRNSTRSGCHSSAISRTCTLTTTTQFQEKIDPYSNESSSDKAIVMN